MQTPMRKEKWSIAQTVYHVNESFEKTILYIHKKMQYPETIEKTNMYTSIKSFLLNSVLRSNYKMKAPEGVITSIPKELPFEQLHNDSLKNISMLKSLLENFPEELMHKNVFRHPVAGRITMYQTLQFLDEHLLHHARQVDKYLQKMN